MTQNESTPSTFNHQLLARFTHRELLAGAGRANQIPDLDAGRSLRPADDARATAQGAPGPGPGRGPLLPPRAVPQRPAPGGIPLCPLRKAHRPAGGGQTDAESSEAATRTLRRVPVRSVSPRQRPGRVKRACLRCRRAHFAASIAAKTSLLPVASGAHAGNPTRPTGDVAAPNLPEEPLLPCGHFMPHDGFRRFDRLRWTL